ncbi:MULTISPECIES: MATE family efflux transporter [Pseudoalteromonas]|uniref:MATE family efflux transporter n=1 Tax=Pseudoalteromonas piscicida TaxID=43662 RepID=A0AAQ2IPX6_PSEO7|nr:MULTISPECIES: MATE family efflux transporter [Pseudoalteromonas]KJY83814.1 multidrug transporter MatE [Pseudoalteromonas piscicida]MCO7200710.1 MATE family efflux transporter [Pseudoalteromonas sp. OANN1]ODB33880.1 MATE family efflux transporter [Pseudoalteromonas sp. BMB]TMN35372.1 MATE family efflux transporter [Pseudoalteromonas piscicida]TMN38040.1 MATE family efflux transporter [Pseudoalteromonas piscicida]
MTQAKSNSNGNDILFGDIGATLKRMTIPMIFGMITLMMFNLVDTFFISMLGTEPLAAISFTFPVTFTVISLAIGLGIGTSAVIAKALGSNLLDEAKFDAAVAIIISAIFVSLLSILGFIFVDEIFILLGAGEAVMPFIHDYMSVWFIGSILLITPMIGNSVLRASGDTKTPSLVMGLGGLVNAVLDPILIFGFGPIDAMGVKGAAVASVLSWSLGVTIILYLLIVKKRLISLSAKYTSFTNAAKKILTIGLPAAGANMLTPLAMAVMTALIASYGPEAVAAFGVGSRIESIASLVVLALSMTLPPFVSQNFGAKQYQRVSDAYTQTLKFVLGFQFAVYLLLVLSAYYISHTFGNEPAVVETIQLFIYIMPLGYGLQGVIILTNSSFNALHKPMNALILSVIRLFIFYVPIAYIGSQLAGLPGLFAGAALGNLFTAAIAYNWFKKVINEIAASEVQKEA